MGDDLPSGACVASLIDGAAWGEAHLREVHRLGRPFIATHHLDRVSTPQSLRFLGATLLWLAISPIPFTLLPIWAGLPLTWLLSCRAFNCLSQVTHMSVHGTLFRTQAVGNLVGDLCAYALGYTLYIRKQTHLEHHRLLNTLEDPDTTWGAPDQTARDMVRGMLGDILGMSIIQKARQYYAVERHRFSRAFERRGIVKFVAGLLLTQGLVAAWYWWLAGGLGYVVLFLCPMATLYPAMIRLRSFVEHNVGHGTGWVSRTIRPSWLERFILAPGHQFLHFEHHAYPGLPLYHLPRLHTYLVQCGAVVDESIGYLGHLRRGLAAP